MPWCHPMPDSGAVDDGRGWQSVGLYGDEDRRGGRCRRGFGGCARSVVVTATCAPVAAVLAALGLLLPWRPLLWAAAAVVVYGPG